MKWYILHLPSDQMLKRSFVKMSIFSCGTLGDKTHWEPAGALISLIQTSLFLLLIRQTEKDFIYQKTRYENNFKNMFNTGTFSCRKCWLTKTYSLSDCWFWRINRMWKVVWRRQKFHNSFSWPSWKNTRGIYSHVAPLLVKDSQKDWSGWHSKFTLGRVRGSQFHCLYVDFRWSISSFTSLRLFLLSFKGNRWNFDKIFLIKILTFNRL